MAAAAPPTPVAAPPPASSPAKRGRGLDALRALPTPGKLVVALVAIVVASGLLLAAVASSVSAARSAMQAVGHRSAPQVAADQTIYFALADMDTQAANWLLVGRRALGSTEADAGAAYYRDRDLTTRDLLAAQAAASGDATHGAIGGVLTGLTTYHGYALQAELLADQGDARAALDEYRLATDLMHTTLLPAMRSVTTANIASLDDAYDAQHSAQGRGVALVVLLGLVLLAVLGLTQWFLVRRTRRIVNPGLAVATLVTLLLFVAGANILAGAASDLDAGRQNAFASLLRITQARADAYDANSDRSRALIDAFRAADYEASFQKKSAEIVDGSLGDDLKATTVSSEHAAAFMAFAAYQQYQRDDGQLVSLLHGGKADEAIAYATSTSHGQSDYDFYQLDGHLQRAAAIDQAYLSAYVAQSDDRLSAWRWLPFVAVGLIVLATVGGLWPRFREYQGV